MPHSLHMLALNDELPIKLIFYVIVGVIWAIGAVASKLKKSGGSATGKRPLAGAGTRPMVFAPDKVAAMRAALRSDVPQLRNLGARLTQRSVSIDRTQPAIVQQAQSMARPRVAAPVARPPVRPANRSTAPRPVTAPPLQRTVPKAITPPIPAPPRPTPPVDDMVFTPIESSPALLADVRALLRPKTLGRQLILSEILRPPLALREREERAGE